MYLCHDLDEFILIGQTNTDMLSLSECTSVRPPVACRMESRIRERMHNLVNEIKGTQDNASSFSCQAHLCWRSADSRLVYWCLVPVGNVRCLAHLVQTRCKRFTALILYRLIALFEQVLAFFKNNYSSAPLVTIFTNFN